MSARSNDPDSVATIPKGTRRLATVGLEAGTRVGKYTVLERIGRGGMATVHAALDNELGRRVALKVMRLPSRAGSSTLLREGQAMARLSHPNIVTVYEIGRFRGRVFLALEHVPGRTLRAWLQDEAPDPGRIVDAFIELARGLIAAHDAALVHRDFKPENVLVDNAGTFKVADFGVARLLDLPADSQPSTPNPLKVSSSAAIRLTDSGVVKGTPVYMAPEQHLGDSGDARADQYAYCIALYEALAGERPFPGKSHDELQRMKLEPERLRRPGAIGPKLWRVIRRGLSIDPDERWPSMHAVVAQLEAIRRPRAWRWLLAGAVVVSLGGAFALRAQAPEKCSATGRLLGVWDPERRDAVEDAFTRSGAPYATESWERVDGALERYATGWGAAYEAACRQPGNLRDVRLACLGSRRAQLQAAVNALAGGAVERSVDLVTGLPALDACTDAVLLGGPPPPAANLAAVVQELEADIARAGARRTTGETTGLVADVEQIVVRARRLGYGPLLARALVEEGALLEIEHDAEPAVEAYREAYFLARELGMDDLALRSATQLTAIWGYDLGRPEEAAVWAGHARAAVERSGRREYTAHLHQVVGANADARGEFGVALEEYRRGLDELLRFEGDARKQRARLLNNMGAAYSGMGQYGQAEEAYRRALELDRERLGSRHPELALPLANLAGALSKTNRREEARALLTDALQIVVAARGPDHPSVASLRTELGNLALTGDDPAGAAQEYEHALSILRATGSGNLRLLARLQNNLAGAYYKAEDLEAAAQAFARAVEMKREHGGPRHPSVAGSLTNLARVHFDREQLGEALPLLEEAVAIRDAAGVARHPEAIATLTLLGRVLAGLGKHAKAVAALRTAESIALERAALDPALRQELEDARAAIEG